MDAHQTKEIEALTFSEASQKLDSIVRALESGDLELEDALDNYALGVALLSNLRARLQDAEQKVEVLLKDTIVNDVDTTSAPSTFIEEN